VQRVQQQRTRAALVTRSAVRTPALDVLQHANTRMCGWVALAARLLSRTAHTHSTLLFDTKHGTDAHDFKLGYFCIVDEHGKTHVIAARC